MSIFDGFLGDLGSGILNPKGNLADFRHASRTFVKNQFRLAPKVKFLYHVYFDFSPAMQQVLLSWADRHKIESGMMVKSVSLPNLTVQIETKKKYNRTKHIQTGIGYEPLTMAFHDDNLGMMTGMLEAYFRYHYADAWGSSDKSIEQSYSKAFANSKAVSSPISTQKTVSIPGVGNVPFTDTQIGTQRVPTILALGDNTYKGSESNKTLHGLNTKPTHPFFNKITISQLSRRTYTSFIIVNPMISNWSYGDMASNANDANELSVTFNYETVWITRGRVKSGKGISGTEPTGFGDLAHYDATPSPNSIYGGGGTSLGGIVRGGLDILNSFTGSGGAENELFDLGSSNEDFNWMKAAIGGANILQNIGGLTKEGITEEAVGLLGAGLEGLQDNIVSGESGLSGADE